MRAHDQIYFFNGKVEICSTREFSSVLRAPCHFIRAPCSVPFHPCSMLHAPCSVLRASMNRTMGIHSFNFSSVLRAACKYELAFSVNGPREIWVAVRVMPRAPLFRATTAKWASRWAPAGFGSAPPASAPGASPQRHSPAVERSWSPQWHSPAVERSWSPQWHSPAVERMLSFCWSAARWAPSWGCCWRKQ